MRSIIPRRTSASLSTRMAPIVAATTTTATIAATITSTTATATATSPSDNNVVVNWFPGHMVKGLRDLAEAVKGATAVVEVRDARAPFTTASPALTNLLSGGGGGGSGGSSGPTRVIVLNKAGLVPTSLLSSISRAVVEREGVEPVTMNANDANVAKVLVSLVEKALSNHSSSTSTTTSSTSNRTNSKRNDPKRSNTNDTSQTSSGRPKRKQQQKFVAGRRRPAAAMRQVANTNKNSASRFSAASDTTDTTDTSSTSSTSITSKGTRLMAAGSEDESSAEQSDKRGGSRPKLARLVVVGVPNVGKSSLINAFRRTLFQTQSPLHGQQSSRAATGGAGHNSSFEAAGSDSGSTVGSADRLLGGKRGGRVGRSGRVARVGAKPGVTRSVHGFRISTSPLVYLIDSPGILPPGNLDPRSSTTLALLGCVRYEATSTETLAAAALEFVNQNKLLEYVARYKLQEPSTDVVAVAESAARSRGWLLRGGKADMERGYRAIVDDLRCGRLGELCFDTLDSASSLSSSS